MKIYVRTTCLLAMLGFSALQQAIAQSETPAPTPILPGKTMPMETPAAGAITGGTNNEIQKGVASQKDSNEMKGGAHKKRKDGASSMHTHPKGSMSDYSSGASSTGGGMMHDGTGMTGKDPGKGMDGSISSGSEMKK